MRNSQPARRAQMAALRAKRRERDRPHYLAQRAQERARAKKRKARTTALLETLTSTNQSLRGSPVSHATPVRRKSARISLQPQRHYCSALPRPQIPVVLNIDACTAVVGRATDSTVVCVNNVKIYVNQLKCLPTANQLIHLNRVAVSKFSRVGMRPQRDMALRLSGGAPTEADGDVATDIAVPQNYICAPSNGVTSNDGAITDAGSCARRAAMSIGLSMMAQPHAKYQCLKGPYDKRNAGTPFTRIPHRMQGFNAPCVRVLFMQDSFLWKIAREVDAIHKKKCPLMHAHILNVIPHEIMPFPGLAFTGMAVISGNHGSSRWHVDASDISMSSGVQFGEMPEDSHEGSLGFACKKGGVCEAVVTHKNGRIISTNYHCVPHAAQQWHHGRLVLSFFARRDILIFFEKWVTKPKMHRYLCQHREYVPRNRADYERLKQCRESIEGYPE